MWEEWKKQMWQGSVFHEDIQRIHIIVLVEEDL